jgi:hypothetical protein
MQNIKTIFKVALLFVSVSSYAQTSYTPLGSKEYTLLERLEIKTRFEGLNASFLKPFNKRLLVHEVELIDSLQRNKNRVSAFLTDMDRYNITRFLRSGKEYTSITSSFNNKKRAANLFEVNKPKFFWAINPALQYQQSFETYSNTNLYLATAGISSHGLIGKKLAFQLFMTGNKEVLPYYVRRYANKFNAIPGFNNYNVTDSALQYYDVRASINWTVAKNIDMQVGYDRNFLGNGIRSLWLSDFSGNYLFLKLNTRFWKFNIENIYAKLTPQFGIVNQNEEKKYLRINTISINATRWLNIGLFDAVVLGRQKQFEMNYVLPFTFLRAMEQQSGSPDNALLGFNVKANLPHGFQVYGQLVLDEFLLKEIKANRGWWANKYGYQFGVKYIDAFKVKNLDLQLETNRVRPFTYTHFDSISNYSNANMPLAHQLGASFQEVIGMARYQPLKKLYLQARLVYYSQGTDTAGQNFGNNILIDYNNRPIDPATGLLKTYGWKVGSGNKATCIYFSANASYEVRENLFLDAGFVFRNYKLTVGETQATSIFNIGFRWNIATKREFDF